MSADNGIYIGRFLRWRCGKCDGWRYLEEHSRHCMLIAKDKTEYIYHVIHAQAIENCDYDNKTPKKVTDAYRVYYYGSAPMHHTLDEALDRAFELEKEILGDNEFGYGILEYGVSIIKYDKPFPKMALEEANAILDRAYGIK